MPKPKSLLERLMERNIDKWDEASMDLTRCKLMLEKTFSKFDLQDRQTDRYKKLYQSTQVIFDHLQETNDPEYQDNLKKGKREKIVSGGIFTLMGAIIVFLIENISGIIELIKTIWGA